MQSTAATVVEYLSELPPDRAAAMQKVPAMGCDRQFMFI